MSTNNVPYQYKKRKSPKIIPNTIMSGAMGFFLSGTPEGVRNSSGKRAISVQPLKFYCIYVSILLCNELKWFLGET